MGANALAELVGLGATFGIGFGIFAGMASAPGLIPTIAATLLMTASGIIEGAVVGLAQWWAVRPAVPAVTRRSWVGATIIGALIAWLLGSVTMTAAGTAAGSAPSAPQPSQGLVLAMAAAVGVGAGALLSLPQWRVLRRHARLAWWWIPANGLAWAAGMPVIVAAVDLAQQSGGVAAGVTVMAAALLAAGAVVGAIHGAVLVALVDRTPATYSAAS